MAKRSFLEEEEDYTEVDKLVTKKAKNKSELIFKAVELSIAVALFIVSLLLPEEYTSSPFTLKTILSILAFAIGGYEIFYEAIGDLISKNVFGECVIMTLVAMCGALLGYVTETTLVIVLFAIGKAVESAAKFATQDRLDELFYTGSMNVTLLSGGVKAINKLTEGDEIALKLYDVIPCDSICKNDVKVDAYNACGKVETVVKAGETVYAGCVLLEDNAIFTVQKTNAQSKLTLDRAAFEKKLSTFGDTPAWVKIVNLAIIPACIALAFIAPIFVGGDYSSALKIWGARAVAITSITTLIYAWSLADTCVKNAVIVARYDKTEFSGMASLETLATANSFEFLSTVLIENGKIKEDVYGCMNELLAAGVKNVSTRFVGETDQTIANKLKFVQKQVKNEKKITVGEFITLAEGGQVEITNGEISYVPLAYKNARRAYGAKRTITIGKIVSAIILSVAALVVPFATVNALYFAAASALVGVCGSVVCLLTASKTY